MRWVDEGRHSPPDSIDLKSEARVAQVEGAGQTNRSERGERRAAKVSARWASGWESARIHELRKWRKRERGRWRCRMSRGRFTRDRWSDRVSIELLLRTKQTSRFTQVREMVWSVCEREREREREDWRVWTVANRQWMWLGVKINLVRVNEQDERLRTDRKVDYWTTCGSTWRS
jgi:hypothetical protein